MQSGLKEPVVSGQWRVDGRDFPKPSTLRNTIFQTFLATSESPLVTAFEPPVTPLLRVALLAVFLTLSPLITSHSSLRLEAQSTNASVTGYVTDPSKAAIAGAKVIAINVDTNVRYEGSSNGVGSYDIPSLPPGPYRLEVEKTGFKTVVKSDLILHVQDTAAINFEMALGSQSEIVTVEGGAPMINTTDASVSTIVDRKFLENMPLNGRSFQDLILLTPGVVTSNPQFPGSVGNNGEFSVNGQRTEANYYTVDGVSANVGISPGNIASLGTGTSLPLSTALGTTQSLVPVDALEEFRVQTSTYSAEYGRNPGGQISLTTRSGTNEWHGSAFEYLRNNAFDANDWFTDYYRAASPAERHNDFGGAFGGPLELPRLYHGRDKTFFFFSYEGLRLSQPQPAIVSAVPTPCLRGTASACTAATSPAPSVLQPVLNAFPLPNCPPFASNCGNDMGNGFGNYIGTWSNPASIDSLNMRFDENLSNRSRIFFRFARTPSQSATRNDAVLGQVTDLTSKTYTLGIINTVSNDMSNDFHVNYTFNDGASIYRSYQESGAVPIDLPKLMGINETTSSAYQAFFSVSIPGYNSELASGPTYGSQSQWNITDSARFSIGTHQLSIGVDFRRLTPKAAPAAPFVEFLFPSPEDVQINSGEGFVTTSVQANPLYKNVSAFIQDEWHVTPRLSTSMGLRWEVNPAPSATDGRVPYTTEGSNVSTLTLAPYGSPLWRTTWFNFAPRFGVAYLLHNSKGWETVIRTGGGVFYDTAQEYGSYGFGGPGLSVEQTYPTSFPLTPAQLNIAVSNPPAPPYSFVAAFPPHLQLPYTLQWDTSLQQVLGKTQSLTLSYLGSHGSRLLENNEKRVGALNPNFGTIDFFQNGPTSDYEALQLQFQRNFARGLSALASYTWSHCIDYGSQNNSTPFQRGACDFDVRHGFSSALSYDLPKHYQSGLMRALLGYWGLDDRFSARTGFPLILDGRTYLDPGTGAFQYGGVDLVPGVPVYLYGPQYPGGRRVNPAAFANPPNGQLGSAPRNFVRGFGTWQMDLAVRREFPISEKLRVQFRAESFNVFNHANFGGINAGVGSAQFGEATATLANSLGVLNPLYQQGGARSMQFAVKLMF